MVNQPGTKHHGIVAKLKQGFTRSEAHRRALATTALARRRFYRPRGRKVASGVPQRNQATKVGRLGAQGKGEAGIGLAEMATALGQRRKLDGAMVVATGKIEEGERRTTTMPGLYRAARKQAEATPQPCPLQRGAERGHERAWKPEEGRRRCSLSGEHCSPNLQNYHPI